MKKIIILILPLLFLVGSCDIEKEPYTAFSDTQVFETIEGLEAATLGAYDLIKQSAFSRGFHRAAEFGSDDVSLSGTTSSPLFFSYNYNHLQNDGQSNALWETCYRAIVTCNKIIENTSPGNDPRTDHIIGENHFLRGFLYFVLVNLWGRPYNQDPNTNLGMPLKLSGDLHDLPPRSTVAETYAQIEKDLLESASLMAGYTRPPTQYNWFASVDAANALLARMYVYMENNEKAIEFADKVINSGRFELLQGEDFARYPTFRPEDNKETIFANRQVRDIDHQRWNAISSIYAHIDGIGWGEMYISQPFRDLINRYPEDLRRNFIRPQYTFGPGEDPQYWIIYIEITDPVMEKSMFRFYNVELNENTGVWEYVKDEQTLQVQTETVNDNTLHYIFEDGVKTYVELQYRMTHRNGYPHWFNIKNLGQEGQAHLWSPIYIRLAEMYLIKAEAYSKLGDDQKAIDNVNIIRQRARIPLYNIDIPVPDGMTSLDVVLQERRLELAFEIHRRFDVFRNGRTMDRRYPGTHDRGEDANMLIPPDHPRVVYFIPERQRLAQPNLINNP
jgi:starch-binding outer membrane protein, SusD/RagB family